MENVGCRNYKNEWHSKSGLQVDNETLITTFNSNRSTTEGITILQNFVSEMKFDCS